MTYRLEFFVCANFDRDTHVAVMPVLVPPEIETTTTTPDLAKARAKAREMADHLGCEIVDTCQEPA